MQQSLHLSPCHETRWLCTYYCSHAGSQQHPAAVFRGSLHTPEEGLSPPAEADLSAATEGASASHAAVANNGQQQQAALSGEGVTSTPEVAPQLLSHGSPSTIPQAAFPAAHPSISAQTHAEIQTNPATVLTPLSLLPLTTQQQSFGKYTLDAPSAETLPAVAVLSAVAITPATKQGHASVEQCLSPQPAMDSMLSGQQQQQKTSRGYISSVSTIDDLSELELDVDSTTGVPAMVGDAPAAQPSAPAVSPSVCQKRPTCQAPLELTSPTIPSVKKHKMDDGSVNAPTPGSSLGQLVGSTAKAQQLAVPHFATPQCALPQRHVGPAPSSPSSKPPSEVSPSVPIIASSPSQVHSQKALTLAVTLPKIPEAAATRTAVPQHRRAAASLSDSIVVEAPQQLMLSLPATCTSPSAPVACTAVSCRLPAALSGGADAQEFMSTTATAVSYNAAKENSSLASVALFSSGVITLRPSFGTVESSPVLPWDMSSFRQQPLTRYRPIIQELPSESAPSTMTNTKAAANKRLPSKAAMVIDIDSDDDHNCAANTQPAASASAEPAASLQGRHVQVDKPSQSQHSIARLSSKPAMQSDHASAATGPVQGQACPTAHPPPATRITPSATIKQAAASKISFDQPPAPMGMGDIFHSFSALEDMSDAEEEEAGTESPRTHQPPAQPLRSSAAMQMPGQPVATHLAGRRALTSAGCCGKCSEVDFGYMPCCKSCNIKYHATCVSAPLSGQCFFDQ